MNAVANSSTAMNAVANSNKTNKYTSGQSISGEFLIIEYNPDNYFGCTFKDGKSLKVSFYRDLAPRGAFLKKYPQIVTSTKVDSDSNDYMLIYKIR